MGGLKIGRELSWKSVRDCSSWSGLCGSISTAKNSLFFSPLLPRSRAVDYCLGQLLFRWTASPYNTRIELLLLLADLIVLFLAVQAFRTLEDWRGFVWFGMFFGFPGHLFAILNT